MKLKNEKGRSMVEMLGVLAIIGVLSVGGISGYNYAMNQISTNKMLNLIQRFYTGLETEIHDPDTPLRKVCKCFTGLTNCSEDRFDQLCQYMGDENCVSYTNGAWGGYKIDGITGLAGDKKDTIYWGYRTDWDSYAYFQLWGMKPELCERVIQQASAFDRLVMISSYCNNDSMKVSLCQAVSDDITNPAVIKDVCHRIPPQANIPIVTLIFDAEPMVPVDARKED